MQSNLVAEASPPLPSRGAGGPANCPVCARRGFWMVSPAPWGAVFVKGRGGIRRGPSFFPLTQLANW